MPRDHTTLTTKISLRYTVLKRITAPVVMETHGGSGRIWKLVYSEIPTGVVFEKDRTKAAVLTFQRPAWAVYEADSAAAIAAGAGAHLPVNVLDVDPYGDPWPTIEAFFASGRPRPDRMAVVVQDGLRHKLNLHAGWRVHSMQAACAHFGNTELYPRYLDVVHWNLDRIVQQAGYTLAEWTSYLCGEHNNLTHFAAVLERNS